MFLFKQVPFLTQDENLECLRRINDLAGLFNYETPGYFATLGMAIYQHEKHFDVYERSIRNLNFKLWEQFSSLYIKIKDFFESFLKSKVLFPALHVSLPGFHVFEIGTRDSFPGGSPHYDLSFRSIPFLKEKSEQYPLHYSFTLPIQLPHYGSGINIWELQFSPQTQFLSTEQKAEKCNTDNAHYVPYQTGSLVIFNGYNYHQIAQIPKTVESDRRITLQGHIVQNGDNFLIYW